MEYVKGELWSSAARLVGVRDNRTGTCKSLSYLLALVFLFTYIFIFNWLVYTGRSSVVGQHVARVVFQTAILLMMIIKVN